MKIHRIYACHPPARPASMKIARLTGLAATLRQDHIRPCQPLTTPKDLASTAILQMSPNRVNLGQSS